MKRAVEANATAARRKIVALGASMSTFAIVVSPLRRTRARAILKDEMIAVTPNNGSHLRTLKMMEGFLEPERVKRRTPARCRSAIEAVRDGKVGAVSLMEPWISYAQKLGLRILIKSEEFDPQRSGERRTQWQDPCCNVPRPGTRGQSAEN